MLEKFDDKAKRAVHFARYEASQHGNRQVELTHLTLGLVRTVPAMFRAVSPLAPAEVFRAIEVLVPVSREKISTSEDLPLGDACKRAFTFAAEEAAEGSVGPHHLLFGLMREDGPEVQLLGSLGIELAAARRVLEQGVPKDPPTVLRRSPQDELLRGMYRDALKTDTPATRRDLEEMLAAVPEDRLGMAAILLAGLSADLFFVSGLSSQGKFVYSHGVKPVA